MNRQMDLEEQVKAANMSYFNRMCIDGYQRNEAIFSKPRQEKIRAILEKVVSNGKNDMLLDVGCGTGNILRLASHLFRRSLGIDIAADLLAKIKQDNDPFLLVGSDGEKLPFRDSTFDCVSMYAVLHHVVEPATLLSEAYRVLKKGGYIYIDHDLNWYCGRFVLPIIRRALIRHASRDLLLAEYHQISTNGLNPLMLKQNLEILGFGEIELVFRHSDNTRFSLPVKAALSMMKFLSKILRRPSLFTHFYIVAKKG